MNYRDNWDLTSIPNDPFWREAGRRNALKRKKKDVDPERRRFLDKKAEAMRRLRAKKKQ